MALDIRRPDSGFALNSWYAGFELAAIGAFELSKLMKSFSIVSHKLISEADYRGRVMPEIANGTDEPGAAFMRIHEDRH